jgi:DNA-binding LytR/AlgR family response regulator
MTLRVMIAEDEAVIARRVARLTTDILGPSAAVSIASNLDEARAAAGRALPDILILDLNLEGRDGFEVLDDPLLRRCPTIVVSAHTERALQAFERGVRDFVPKPFGRERLEVALRRAIEHAPQPSARLGLRSSDGARVVPFDDIVYARAAGAHSALVLTRGRVIEGERMLDRLEQLLPAHFERIHKSVIVDTRRIERLVSQAGSRYCVLLADGTSLPVGRTRVAALRARLG